MRSAPTRLPPHAGRAYRFGPGTPRRARRARPACGEVAKGDGLRDDGVEQARHVACCLDGGEHAEGGFEADGAATVRSPLLRDQDPHLIHLWRREQGFLVPRGGAGSVATAADLSGLRVARRETGAGTRVLLDQLLLGAGIAPESVPGPELASHLECGLAVAAGIADVALGLRSAARDLDLEFVSVGWEPYEVVVPAATLPAALRLLDGLAVPALRAGIEALGGYDLADAATVRRLAPG